MPAKTQSPVVLPPPPTVVPTEDRSHYWFARHSKSIIFLILMLAAVGVYEALSLPIAVFPSTNFPRIIVGVDNGVMPIDQMEVTITRPLEEAVNSVPGPRRCPLDHQPRLGRNRSCPSTGTWIWCRRCNWSTPAISRIQSTLPVHGRNRNAPAGFRELSRFLATASRPTKSRKRNFGKLATYDMKPRLNRLNGVASILVQGGAGTRIPDHARPGADAARPHVTLQDILDAANKTNMIDSPGLPDPQSPVFSGPDQLARCRRLRKSANMVIKDTQRRPGSDSRYRHRYAVLLRRTIRWLPPTASPPF